MAAKFSNITETISEASRAGQTGGGCGKLWSGSAALHPSLQDQDGCHAVDGLAALFDREVGLAQKAVGLCRREALVPEVDGEFEVLAEVLGEGLDLFGLDAFDAAHAERQSDDDFCNFVVADNAVEILKVVLLVFPMERLEALRSDAERIGNSDSDSSRTYIETENAAC